MTSIAAVLQQAVTDGAVPGLVAAAGSGAGFRGEWTAGSADAAGRQPMQADAIFRVASMAKLVTAVAVLILVDRGKLDLDEHVTGFLPEYGDLVVVEGFDAAGPRVRPPARPATIRELMAHTAGLAYNTFEPLIDTYERVTGAPNIGTGRRDALKLPLVADPGRQADYGTGFDWAGLVVEAIDGRALDDFCEQEIFAPLGMTRTSMRRPEDRGVACTPVLAVAPGGGFAPSDADFPRAPEFAFGGGFLFTTAGDYLKLALELAAPRAGILSPGSVAEVFANQSGALDIPVMRSARPAESHDLDLGPGWKWGLGVALNPSDVPGGRRAGSGGWAGIFNTHFWIDPASGVAGCLFLQFQPFFDPGAIALCREFETAVYATAHGTPVTAGGFGA
ncbi:MAG TPA: serine hydrolase domain-containing protein [Trebonia sp.]|jgi:CubicO group peptidase (beta-lactamase class C family)|nr:serine hydrolase domain-containing protein [Trebonia sp.]